MKHFLAVLCLVLFASSLAFATDSIPHPKVDITTTTLTQWRTALDCNFTTENAQTLGSDTTFSICGVTWTKINTAAETSATTIADAGINFQPAAATDYTAAARTIVAITAPLGTLIPTVTPDTPIRVSFYVASANSTANYHTVLAAFDQNGSNKTHFATGYGWLFAANGTAAMGVCSSTTILSTGTATAPFNNLSTANAFRLTLPTGYGGARYVTSATLYNAGFPADGLWAPITQNICTTAVTWDFTTTGGGWTVLLGAMRLGSGTAYSATVARVKVEYYQ